jgi:cation diffusion facilitator CzcD-associated flavoprotein CzcO
MSSADSPGERYEVVVIGAGQAGLAATGQFLS